MEKIKILVVEDEIILALGLKNKLESLGYIVTDIADSGNIMPPKTTWFEPKLRSGLVVHSLA